MPPPKKLERIQPRVFELLASAEHGKIDINFSQEERGAFVSLAMQVRNAIMLFRQADPKTVPPNLKGLAQFAGMLSCAIYPSAGRFEIGPATEVGMGALIAKAIRENDLVVNHKLLMSDRQLKTVEDMKSGKISVTGERPSVEQELAFLKQAVATAPEYKPDVGTTQLEQHFSEEGLPQCLPPDPRTLVD